MIDMAKLRPRDIFFNDPYFDYTTCSKPGDLRLAKRVEVFGKWYKTPNLVTTLLSQERLTFSRYTGTDKEDALVLRIYERTADRLLINTYYTSQQNPEEIYAGTIHLERYDMAQTMESFSYMGIIDLLMLQTDSQILELTNVFEDVQMAKHAVAHALGIYLMAICDQPWSDEAVTGGQETPAMMMGKEKEELQQLREEKAQMDADKEELLRLRLEAKNRTTVLAELERLRQELESERAGREQERKQYEDRIRKQEQYIEKIKETASGQIAELLALRKELNKRQVRPDLSSGQAHRKVTPQEASRSARDPEDRGLDLPSFMTQRDYTRQLDRFLTGRQLALAGGDPDWQRRIQRRFGAVVIISGQPGDDRMLKESALLVINMEDGKTPLIRWAITEAKEKGCPILPIGPTNLNGFAKAIVGRVSG